MPASASFWVISPGCPGVSQSPANEDIFAEVKYLPSYPKASYVEGGVKKRQREKYWWEGKKGKTGQ